MEFLAEKILAVIVAVICPFLTIFDLPGNSIMLLTGIGLAFFDEARYFSGRLLSVMILTYLLGEAWEFCVALFGIKKEKVSWLAVLLIALGGFVGTLLGTAFLPVLGSIIGGMAGAGITAFFYELARTGIRKDAAHLALVAAKTRFFALLGKVVAAITLAVLLLKQVYF